MPQCVGGFAAVGKRRIIAERKVPERPVGAVRLRQAGYPAGAEEGAEGDSCRLEGSRKLTVSEQLRQWPDVPALRHLPAAALQTSHDGLAQYGNCRQRRPGLAIDGPCSSVLVQTVQGARRVCSTCLSRAV